MKKLLLCGALALSLNSIGQIWDCDTTSFDQFTMTFDAFYSHDTPVTNSMNEYQIVISDTFFIASGGNAADAAYEYGIAPTPAATDYWFLNSNYIRPDVDVYKPNHTYEYIVTGDGSPLTFEFNDGNYTDNGGFLKFTVKEIICVDVTGIEEITLGTKELVRVVDLMGREITPQKNRVLIYIYSDGTTERIFEFE